MSKESDALNQVLSKSRGLIDGLIRAEKDRRTPPEMILANVLLQMIGVVLWDIREMKEQATFGRNKFSITPYTLSTVPTNIVDKDSLGRIRKVSIVADTASGGPTPTIRIGTGSVTTSSGGVLLAAGDTLDLGEVEPNQIIRGVASTSFTVYVVERL